ncbi:uncharacterized protein [Anabrus simplex]|uniref:uncharacterized protein n=1 Tax=Anabrus simplex TaxID=316456 RepID=UPI0035A36163
MKTTASHYLALLVGCLLYRATDLVREIQSAVSPGIEVLNTTSLDIVQWKRIVHSPDVVWHSTVLPVDEEYILGHYGCRKHRKRHRSHPKYGRSHRSKKTPARRNHHRYHLPSKGCGKCSCCRAHAAGQRKFSPNGPGAEPRVALRYIHQRGLYSGNPIYLGKWGNNLYPSYVGGYGDLSLLGPRHSNLNSYHWA